MLCGIGAGAIDCMMIGFRVVYLLELVLLFARLVPRSRSTALLGCDDAPKTDTKSAYACPAPAL